MNTTDRHKLVFIDDERFYAREYIDEFSIEYDVEYYQTALEGIGSIGRNSERICVVLDVMMPPPSPQYWVETDGGLTTGIWALAQVADGLRLTGSTVILLTNRDEAIVHERIKVFGLEDLHVTVISKSSTTPRKLRETLSAFRSAKDERSG